MISVKIKVFAFTYPEYTRDKIFTYMNNKRESRGTLAHRGGLGIYYVGIFFPNSLECRGERKRGQLNLL